MKEETRKEIRQKMADYRQPAPEVSWDVLEKALAGNKPARKVALWPKRVAAAAAVLLLAGLGWQALKLADKSLDEEGTELVQNPTGEVTDGQNKSPDQYADGSLEKEQQATSEKFMERSASQLVAGIPVHNTEELPVTEEIQKNVEHQQAEDAMERVQAEDVTERQQAADAIERQKAEETIEQQKAKETLERQREKEQKAAQETPVRRQEGTQPIYPSRVRKSTSGTDRKLVAKVYFSNTMTGSQASQGGQNLPMNSVQPMSDANGADPSNRYYFMTSSFKVVNNVELPVEENIHHRQPVRVGMSVRYPLGGRWSMESGLQYSRLTAQITRSSVGKGNRTDQELNYLGVPLSVSYLLAGGKHLSVYASAGGTVEKMVRGKRTTKEVTGSTEGPAQTESVSIKPLQWSVNGSVGAEYHLNQTLSLYAEPGVSYHFDNHSSIPTYYQEKPLGFSLNLGLRINLNK